MADKDFGTHYEGCEQYHLECAKHALADRDRRIEALTKALQSAIHALRSYQCGNSSSELAQSVADACSKALASAAGAEGEA